MPFFDFPLEKLETYRPDGHEPVDFESFWLETLREHDGGDQPLERETVARHLHGVAVQDLTLQGFGKNPVKAWYIRPAGESADLPLICSFVGYGGGRGLPEEHLVWASSGFANLVVDTRGQGAQWGGGGDTGDLGWTGPAQRGNMTRGIEDPTHYYYRRVFTDAVNAVRVGRNLPGVDASKVITAGSSQGGALALASAALTSMTGGAVAGTIANVPFLSDFKRAVGLTGALPYQEIADYLQIKRDMETRVFKTLAYFDMVNMCKRAVAPALFSTGLMDTVTPPSTVFAAKNWYAGETEIEVYRFNGHEGGGVYQVRRELAWAQNLCDV